MLGFFVYHLPFYLLTIVSLLVNCTMFSCNGNVITIHATILLHMYYIINDNMSYCSSDVHNKVINIQYNIILVILVIAGGL